jgi:DNA-binding HxlR family transcriptional regulator
MSGYGQFCPIAKAAQVLAERWTPLVLRELICGSTRFNDLRRGVPLMSSSLLSQRLKFLEQEGVIERRPAASGRGFEYHLTDAPARSASDAGRRWRSLSVGTFQLREAASQVGQPALVPIENPLQACGLDLAPFQTQGNAVENEQSSSIRLSRPSIRSRRVPTSLRNSPTSP